MGTNVGWTPVDLTAVLEKNVDLKSALDLKFFCIASGRQDASFENAFIPSLRLGLFGSRKVLMVDAVLLKEFQTTNATRMITPAKLKNDFLEIKGEELKEFGQQHPGSLFVIAQDPGECSWIPAGWLAMDCVGEEYFVGIRVPVIVKQQQTQMEAVNSWLQQIQKPSAVL